MIISAPKIPRVVPAGVFHAPGEAGFVLTLSSLTLLSIDWSYAVAFANEGATVVYAN